MLGLGRIFSFLILYTVGRTTWDGAWALRKATTYTQNKRTQTSMPLLGFEPTTPVFERGKTVHTLDHVATVIGIL
jgi:hypothetical protein